VFFLVTAIIGRWRLPIVGGAMLIIASIVVGGVYPWIVQRFQVDPSARTLEAPYIQRNIDGTRAAFGLDKVTEVLYDATTTAEPGALREDAETTAKIRIIDPVSCRTLLPSSNSSVSTTNSLRTWTSIGTRLTA